VLPSLVLILRAYYARILYGQEARHDSERIMLTDINLRRSSGATDFGKRNMAQDLPDIEQLEKIKRFLAPDSSPS
jgi:hypothetical protein